MRIEEFSEWLRVEKNMSFSTISSRISNIRRVSKVEGNLDNHYRKDNGEYVLNILEYSKSDFENNIPAKHKININGDIVKGTYTLRAAVELYFDFLEFSAYLCKDNKKTNDGCNKSNYINNEEGIIFDKICDKKELAESEIKKLDSYQIFAKTFNITKSDFYKFGLDETIYPKDELIDVYWTELKDRLFNNNRVYIRGYGRDAKGTDLYKEFHLNIFGNQNIFKDPTNNSVPQRLIESLTGLKRNEHLFNYQVSHIFGMTRNGLMFECPWNIVLVPKIIDPLTGHESKGDWQKEYKEIFMNYIHSKYAKYIEDYNQICIKLDFQGKIEKFVLEKLKNTENGIDDDNNTKKRLLKNFNDDFKVIDNS